MAAKFGMEPPTMPIPMKVSNGPYLGAAAVAANGYALVLMLLPHGLVALSLGTVIFPQLARLHAAGDRAAFRETTLGAVRGVLFLALPAAALLGVLSAPIVRALFEPAGYAVRVARTAADGLAAWTSGTWGVALVDGALSADGNRRLIEALHPGPGQRVLVATAEPAVQRVARELGFGVLPRPFLPRDVVARAGDLLPVPAPDQGEVAR